MHEINEVPGQVSFLQAIKDFFLGFFDFKGRTTRAGYWWMNLFYMSLVFWNLVLIFTKIVAMVNGDQTVNFKPNYNLAVASFVVFLILAIPGAAMTVRRFRDVGVRGGGTLLLFVAGVILSVTIPNQYIIVPLIFVGIFWILSLFPTNSLTIRTNNAVLRFFFREKKSAL